MNKFRKMIMKLQGRNKRELFCICNSDNWFSYDKLYFRFDMIDYHNIDTLLLYLKIPADFFDDFINMNSNAYLAYESFMLDIISKEVEQFNDNHNNFNKDIKEQAKFYSQKTNGLFLKRSGIHFDDKINMFIIKIGFAVPLINTSTINIKLTYRSIKEILQNIVSALNSSNHGVLIEYIKVYLKQQEIRKMMIENEYIVFIADGSILPRESSTNFPMKAAQPFVSPDSLKVYFTMSDGTSICGMGIKRGITAITGGGYSGKSTLLNAIELGIYNHIPGDGREYVLTDKSAIKVCVEDGRPISNVDVTPFFNNIPGNECLNNFSTTCASGSVSQAANIIEAVYGGSKLLLIDEDKSSNNFMLSDNIIRLIVQNDPIIPFIERISELYLEKSVSTVIVIGSSSAYLSCADTVILMDNYIPKDITQQIKKFDLPFPVLNAKKASWMCSRHLIPRTSNKAFIFFTVVDTKNEKKIVLDDFESDITFLTSIISKDQLNTLVKISESILTDKQVNEKELMDKIKEHTEKILYNENIELLSFAKKHTQHFFEAVRPIDVMCCINRMRGLDFSLSNGAV